VDPVKSLSDKKRVIERGDLKALTRWATSGPSGSASTAVPSANKGVAPAAKAGAKPMAPPKPKEPEFKRGYEEGFEQGLKEGREQGQKALTAQIQAFQKMLNDAEAFYTQLNPKIEEELVKLALTLAKQIIRREIQTQPGQIVSLVREVLSRLSGNVTDIRIHVHPEDAQLLREHMSQAEQEKSWQVVDDSTVTRGGCRINTSSSIVDATFEKQIAAISAQILGDDRGGTE
jgi:flagellar assembly protein FliH